MNSIFKTHLTDVAKLDMSTPVSSLFKVLPKREKAHQRMVEHVVSLKDTLQGKEVELEINYVSPYTFDHFSWKLLITVAALCGYFQTDVEADTAEHQKLWLELKTSGAAARGKGCVYRGTVNQVLAEMGMDTKGSNRKRFMEKLRHLSYVQTDMIRTVTDEDGKLSRRRVSGANLLSYAIDEDDGTLTVILNPQIARFILHRTSQFTLYSMTEIRSLKAPAAIILHGHLSCRVRKGARKESRFHIDKLVEIAYAEEAPNDRAHRHRVKTVREALGEIAKLEGWHIQIDPQGIVSIRRR